MTASLLKDSANFSSRALPKHGIGHIGWLAPKFSEGWLSVREALKFGWLAASAGLV